jgi:hypothetical protein
MPYAPITHPYEAQRKQDQKYVDILFGERETSYEFIFAVMWSELTVPTVWAKDELVSYCFNNVHQQRPRLIIVVQFQRKNRRTDRHVRAHKAFLFTSEREEVVARDTFNQRFAGIHGFYLQG